jgi:hypothetical protein
MFFRSVGSDKPFYRLKNYLNHSSIPTNVPLRGQPPPPFINNEGAISTSNKDLFSKQQ